MAVTKLNSKSQIALPAEVRTHLRLVPGDSVIIEVEGDRAVLRRKSRSVVAELLALADPETFAGASEELERSRDAWDRAK